jgi:hypothetical protein
MAKSKLKQKLVRGDRKIIAAKAFCHSRTVDEALEGKTGSKRDRALEEIIKLVEKRENNHEKYAS